MPVLVLAHPSLCVSCMQNYAVRPFDSLKQTVSFANESPHVRLVCLGPSGTLFSDRSLYSRRVKPSQHRRKCKVPPLILDTSESGRSFPSRVEQLCILTFRSCARLCTSWNTACRFAVFLSCRDTVPIGLDSCSLPKYVTVLLCKRDV